MGAPRVDELRWETRQRLMLLEARVIWASSVGTQDLRGAFGISRAQASKDFALYQEMAPRNLHYDLSAKCYRPTAQFEPLLLHGTAREFLQVLRNRGIAGGTPLAVVADDVAPVEVLEPPEREFDVRILQRVTMAIRERRWLLIEYQSMTHPDPRLIRIAPHALAHAGRWHARAFSALHEDYRDFLLSRISGVPELGEADAPGAGDDWDWNNFVNVRIGAHPDLTPPQRRVVEADWNMRSGVYERPVRVALVPYFLRTLNVGGDDVHRPAARQQVVLLNREELAAFDRLG